MELISEYFPVQSDSSAEVISYDPSKSQAWVQGHSRGLKFQFKPYIKGLKSFCVME